ncbi:MAG: hypothetical protein ACO29V_03065, partial [Limnohabitans sp.]
ATTPTHTYDAQLNLFHVCHLSMIFHIAFTHLNYESIHIDSRHDPGKHLCEFLGAIKLRRVVQGSTPLH